MTQQVSSGGGGAPPTEVTQHLWIEGDAAKIEMSGGPAMPMFEPGSYLLSREAGKQLYLVDPRRRTYAAIDPVALAQGAQAMAGSGVEVTFSGVEVTKLLEEPGGERRGYDTTHYRFQTRYTRTMKMGGGMSIEQEIQVVEDVWTAPGIAGGEGAAAMALMGSAGLPAEHQQRAGDAKASLRGVPLEHVTVMEIRAKGGTGMLGRMMQRQMGNERMTTKMVVQSIREESVPLATFEIPAGFRETSLMQGGATMPDLGGQR